MAGGGELAVAAAAGHALRAWGRVPGERYVVEPVSVLRAERGLTSCKAGAWSREWFMVGCQARRMGNPCSEDPNSLAVFREGF